MSGTIGSVSVRGFLASNFKCDKRKEGSEITCNPTITTPLVVDPIERTTVALRNIYSLNIVRQRTCVWISTWTHHNTRGCTYLWWAACACAGSWLRASWWRPCPGEHWRCAVKAAGEPGHRTPPSLCCADSELRREIFPFAALSWSCKQENKEGHTIVPNVAVRLSRTAKMIPVEQ